MSGVVGSLQAPACRCTLAKGSRHLAGAAHHVASRFSPARQPQHRRRAAGAVTAAALLPPGPLADAAAVAAFALADGGVEVAPWALGAAGVFVALAG